MSDDDPDLFTEPPPPPPDNVVQFRRPGDADAPPPTPGPLDAIERAAPAKCSHARILLDEKLRRVTCRVCGETLDAIQCLINLATYREQLAQERRWIEAEKRRAQVRQQRAIARRMFAKQKVEAAVARANCQVCQGTGWAPRPGGGVSRCTCRQKGERLL